MQFHLDYLCKFFQNFFLAMRRILAFYPKICPAMRRILTPKFTQHCELILYVFLKSETFVYHLFLDHVSVHLFNVGNNLYVLSNVGNNLCIFSNARNCLYMLEFEFSKYMPWLAPYLCMGRLGKFLYKEIIRKLFVKFNAHY